MVLRELKQSSCRRNSLSIAIKPREGRENWRIIYKYTRTTNQDFAKNFKNFEFVMFPKPFILDVRRIFFIAIHSTKRTSNIGISHPSKTKSTDVTGDENLEIRPGKSKEIMSEDKFFTEISKFSSTWALPCGRIYYSVVCCFVEILQILNGFFVRSRSPFDLNSIGRVLKILKGNLKY